MAASSVPLADTRVTQRSDLTPRSRARDQRMRVLAYWQARMQIMGRTGSDETQVEAEQSRKHQRLRSIERLSRSVPAEPEDEGNTLPPIQSGDTSPRSPAAHEAARHSLSTPTGTGAGIQQCHGGAINVHSHSGMMPSMSFLRRNARGSVIRVRASCTSCRATPSEGPLMHLACSRVQASRVLWNHHNKTHSTARPTRSGRQRLSAVGKLCPVLVRGDVPCLDYLCLPVYFPHLTHTFLISHILSSSSHIPSACPLSPGHGLLLYDPHCIMLKRVGIRAHTLTRIRGRNIQEH